MKKYKLCGLLLAVACGLMMTACASNDVSSPSEVPVATTEAPASKETIVPSFATSIPDVTDNIYDVVPEETPHGIFNEENLPSGTGEFNLELTL